MKRHSLALFLLFFFSLAAWAQTMPLGHQMLSDPEKFADGHVVALDSQVHLTDAQKAKLRPVFLDEGKQLFAVLNDPSLQPAQTQAAIQKLHIDTAATVNSMLTPEQRRQSAPMDVRPLPSHTTQT